MGGRSREPFSRAALRTNFVLGLTRLCANTSPLSSPNRAWQIDKYCQSWHPGLRSNEENRDAYSKYQSNRSL